MPKYFPKYELVLTTCSWTRLQVKDIVYLCAKVLLLIKELYDVRRISAAIPVAGEGMPDPLYIIKTIIKTCCNVIIYVVQQDYGGF